MRMSQSEPEGLGAPGVNNGVTLAFKREGRSCRGFLFHEPLEVLEIGPQRSGKHYRFDDGTNFHSHSCSAVVERVEKHDTDAKMIGHRLPCDPAVRNAHDYPDLACHFFAIDDRRA